MSSPPSRQSRHSKLRPWTIHDSNIAVHQCLSTIAPTKPALPNEIILQILDHPTRWIPVHSVSLRVASPNEPLRCKSQGPQRGDWQILCTDPIDARVAAKIKTIVYSFTSKDQGWSSYPEQHGTFEGSCTFLEAGLTRFEVKDAGGEELARQQSLRVEKESERYELHRNRHAGREPEEYRIGLGEDHELLRRVQDGDRFALWARAQYPGWENVVYGAKIELWCVDDLSD